MLAQQKTSFDNSKIQNLLAYEYHLLHESLEWAKKPWNKLIFASRRLPGDCYQDNPFPSKSENFLTEGKFKDPVFWDTSIFGILNKP